MEYEDENSNGEQGEQGLGSCYPAFATTVVFPTKDAVYKYLQSTAKNVGFKLVQGSGKQNQNGPSRVYCICNRGRPDKEVRRSSFDVVRRVKTSTKSCACPFKIVMQENSPFGGWIVKPCLDPQHGTHNHALSVSGVSSGLSVEAKQFIQQMNDSVVAPRHINAALNETFPDDNQNIRHVYNQIAACTRESRGGRNSAENCLHLASTSDYITFHKKATGGALTHLFLAHPGSVETFRTYPWVICIDSTYKTNRYGMPLIEMVGMSPCNLNFLIAYAIVIEESADTYQWVLEMLKNLIVGQNYPNVIVTDRELGLIRPIQAVFPESKHLLCTWHINKDVESRVTILTKSKKHGASFLNGVWLRVAKAPTMAMYEVALEDMRTSWSSHPSVISYVESTWLNPHKEKFARAWTNQVLHFKNTTTCRVESAHSSLKCWLQTSTGALDTVFKRVHLNILGQLKKIDDSLGKSRNSVGRLHRGTLFGNLINHVSHHCLDKLVEENKRRETLGAQVYAYCGCALRTTHAIPCACLIQQTIDGGGVLYLDQIHPFFRTLVLCGGVNTSEGVSREEQDQAALHRAWESVVGSDPTIQRKVANYVEELIRPGDSGVVEPENVINKRGRPTEHIPRSRSTMRDTSFHEHVNRRYESGRGRSSKSPGRKSIGRSNKGTFPYLDHVPHIMKPFIIGWNDVEADGNCGFRCVADAFQLEGENDWAGARRAIHNELAANWPIYVPIYSGTEMIVAARKRIRHRTGGCGPEHWFQVTDDLFPVACAYNCAVVLYSVADSGSIWGCCTVLPLRGVGDDDGPSRELHIVHISHLDHFVRIFMKPNSPMPPLHQQWIDNRYPEVIGWEGHYARRMAAWNRVYPPA